MRSASVALAAHLDGNTAGMAPRHLVTVTLRGGTVYRWTDHEWDLSVGGNTFYSGGQGTTHPQVRVGKSTQLAGADIASLSLTLDCADAAMLGSKRLPLAAAQRAFDGAVVKVERVFLDMEGAIADVRVGFLTASGTGWGTGDGRKQAIQIQPAADLTAERIYVATSANASASGRLLLYADNGSDAPGALLAQTSERVGIPAGEWNEALLSPVALVAGTKYWLAFHSDLSVGITPRATEAGVVGTSWLWNADTYTDGPSNPFGAAFVTADRPAALAVAGEPATWTTVDTDAVLHWFEGLVGEVAPSSTRVEIDVESGVAALSVEIPRRRFTPGCSNVLFDAQCGIDVEFYTGEGTAGAGSTAGTINASGIFYPTGYFDLGVLTMTSGALAGERRAVRAHTEASGANTFALDRSFPSAPSVGDTFEVIPGCDKRLETCAAKFGFDNSARFTGFKFVPREGPVTPPSSVGASARAVAGLPPLPPAKESRLYGEPVPLVYGKTRVEAQPIYVGPASGNPPSADVLGALCEGPIAAVDRIFYEGAAAEAAAGVAGISLLTVMTGTRPTQAAWAELPAGKNLGYPGTAMVGQTVQLDGGRPPAQTWEVLGLLSGTGGSSGDAHPAKVILDMLGRDPTTGNAKAHDPYGAGFKWPVVTAAGLDGGAASSFARWVEQNEFWISPALTSRRSARDWLEEVCEAVNAECLWSEGKLKIVPRGDAAVGTFAPVLDVQYALSRADLVEGGDGGPTHMELAPEADAANVCPVSFKERAPEGVVADPALAYQEATEQDPDPVDVSNRGGERPAGTVSLLGVTSRAHALKISRMMAQRAVRVRRTVKVTVPWRFCRLEPLDLVTASDDLFPLNGDPVQIREIEESEVDGVRALTITAWHWEGGLNFASVHSTTSSDGSTTPYATNRTEEIQVVRGVAEQAADDAAAAQATADDALVLAGSGTRVYHQAAAPTVDLVEGALWFSTDTTTTCPVSACKGHTLDPATNEPRTGAYPHRGAYWPHRWNGTAWEDVERQGIVVASEIATGAIVTDKLAANAVTTEKIAAGSVTADHLAVGGQNLLTNADFSALRRFGANLTDPTYGDIWLETWDVRQYEGRPCTVGINLSADWTLFGDTNVSSNPGGNTAYIAQASGHVDGAPIYAVASDFVPVTPSAYYLASVYTGAHRCEGRVEIQWYTAAKAYISSADDPGGATTSDAKNVAEKPGLGSGETGQVLTHYKRVWRKAQAPGSAAFARVRVIKYDTLSGASPADSYLFFARPMFEEAAADQAQPGRWSPSGLTLIDGGRISAGSMRTTNYAEDGSGNPTAGAKLDHMGTALKVAPGNFQLGARNLTDLGMVVAAVMLDNAGSTRTTFDARNIASVTRVQIGSYYHLQFEFTHPTTSYVLTPVLTLQSPGDTLPAVHPVLRSFYSTGGGLVHGLYVTLRVDGVTPPADPNSYTFQLRVAVLGFGNWT